MLPSPDGRYLLVFRQADTAEEAGYGRRGALVEVWDLEGRALRVIARREALGPSRSREVEPGARGARWQETAPATLVWFELEDERRASRGDRVMRLPAPFTSPPGELFATEHRVAGIQWLACDEGALVSEYDRLTRGRWTWRVSGEGGSAQRVSWSGEAAFGAASPERLLTAPSEAGREVVAVHDGFVYLTGREPAEEMRPFLDRYDLETQRRERLWQSAEGRYEVVLELLAPDAGRLLVRRESRYEPPSYALLDRITGERLALSEPAAAAPALHDVRRERLGYRRADGVALSATLYLPPGHRDRAPLPLVVWAYPSHYADPEAMAGRRRSPHRFPSIRGLSPLMFVTQGYAVMTDVSMPVLGAPDGANDTFVEQVIANARAAIDAAAKTGLVDPDRVGIVGHSYGAFMAVNLLAHSDLFEAGIAASGAYNRTLTPFGFQTERRSLWEARGAYLAMSPFLYADQIEEPLLLVHGELDDNPGTAPEQSERLYWAIRENGGIARLLMLPFEGHVYRARESVLHTAAEMLEWFERHLRAGAGPAPAPLTANAQGRRPG